MYSAAMLKKDATTASKLKAVLCYLGILCLVPLVLDDKNHFLQFHSRQGLVLWILEVAAGFMLIAIPGFGGFLFSAIMLACIGYSLYGLTAVVLGKAWELPLIGIFADRL